MATLSADGLLETQPGIGTVVAALPEARNSDRAELLGPDIEQLVVEAKRLGIECEDVLASVATHWKRLTAKTERGRDKK